MMTEGGSLLASKETSSPGTPGKSKDHKGNVLPHGKFGVGWRCSNWEENKQSGQNLGTVTGVLHQPDSMGDGYCWEKKWRKEKKQTEQVQKT